MKDICSLEVEVKRLSLFVQLLLIKKALCCANHQISDITAPTIKKLVIEKHQTRLSKAKQLL